MKQSTLRTTLAAFALTALAGCAARDAGSVVAYGAMSSEVPSFDSLSEGELRIWNDPTFQRQFIQSYLSETEIEPRVTPDERDRMQKILEFISADQVDRAVAQIERHRGKASSAVFDFTLANIYFQNDRLDEAADTYRVAIDKHPKFRRAWRNLALIHMRQQNYEEALPALARVIELGGGDGVIYGLLGFAHASLENDLSAESAYRMAILFDPETLDWQLGLARSYFKLERFADAASLLGSLISRDADRADYWLLQANAYIGMNQPLRAAENFEIVHGLGQSTPESLNTLGDIYINEGLSEPAVTAYLTALEMDATASPARPLRAARVLTAQGDREQARRLLEGIEQLDDEQLSVDHQKEVLRLRARLAVAQGAGDEEAQILEEIVALDPLDGEALILLGQYNARAGNAERAAFYYERAMSIEEFEADANVRHAQLLVSQGKYAEALLMLRRAQMLKPRENIQAYLDQVERIAKSRTGER